MKELRVLDPREMEKELSGLVTVITPSKLRGEAKLWWQTIGEWAGSGRFDGTRRMKLVAFARAKCGLTNEDRSIRRAIYHQMYEVGGRRAGQPAAATIAPLPTKTRRKGAKAGGACQEQTVESKKRRARHAQLLAPAEPAAQVPETPTPSQIANTPEMLQPGYNKDQPGA
jgi:hypothetical protein